MLSEFSDTGTGENPQEQDADPGRSPADQSAFHTALVSDDTEDFEDPQTGIFLTCDPTDAEIRSNIRKTGFLRAANVLNFLVAAVVAVNAVSTIPQSVSDGAKGWAILICQCVVAVLFFAMPFWTLNQETKKYRESGAGKLTVYPDRVELTECGVELPLDGTGELLRTESAFTLIYPPKEKSHDRSLRFLIIPRRCISRDLLPYVEAMLAAGTKPRRE